jgi:hypothetical protein
VKRVRLPFAKGLEVEFIDMVRGIKQVYEFAERGTRFPVVVYGPEGCGKTSWLLQAVEVLKDLGYGVIYFNPLRKEFEVEVGIESIKRRALELVKEVASEYLLAKYVWSVIDFVNEVLRQGRRKLAVIVDDVFQYLEPRWAAVFVKGMLELIEHPVESYERIVAIVATSEGLSRREIGRHLWAWSMPMWNMGKEGFEELYSKLPSPKPPFEDVWRLSGGNPRILSRLYQLDWNVNTIINVLIEEKEITPTFVGRWRSWLELAVEDPDNLWDPNTPEELVNELIRKNLILYHVRDRVEGLWIDEPPPKKDLELGIGEYVAWQTPIHREAVRKTLERYR